VRWQLHGVSYIVSKRRELRSANGFKVGLCFPTLRKFRIRVDCQTSRTEISKQNSTKLCQTLDGKSREQSSVKQLESSIPKKLRAKNFCICSVFRRLRLNGDIICRTKRDIDNRQGLWKVRRVSYVVPKFHELWSTNGLRPDRTF